MSLNSQLSSAVSICGDTVSICSIAVLISGGAVLLCGRTENRKVALAPALKLTPANDLIRTKVKVMPREVIYEEKNVFKWLDTYNDYSYFH